jgi:catechol-2,3-dioxygenase
MAAMNEDHAHAPGSSSPSVSDLLHVELSCIDVEASREFFTSIMGMQEQGRADGVGSAAWLG